jgi:hypothetical protein
VFLIYRIGHVDHANDRLGAWRQQACAEDWPGMHSLVNTKMILHPNVAVTDLQERGNVVNWGKLRIADLSRQEVLQLFCYQYITLARRTVTLRSDGRAS